ncbi:MAG: hypothetical protein HETSPECPRED_008514 [Heterodermia speciosa]|uniref:Transcription initiation factor TFIID subunit 10 n=1 Tax=Heterodermia speciosa TaxID=116794 RepID=A0A8H3IXX1_9LECA|nr:MAG: hypothetical protein HETSPECPRED_008514 [Heterodermia speciosa]
MADLPSTSQPPTTDSTQAGPDQTLDGTLDIDIDMNLNPQPEPGSREATTEAIPEPPPAPTKKDITLREFLSKMDDYAPIIPDAVTQHHLLIAGLPPSTTPLPLSRLLALATQKFIADIAADAYQYSRMRSSASGSSGANAAGAGPGAQAAGGGGLGGKEAGVGVGTGGGGGGGKGDKSTAHVLGVQRSGYGGGGSGGGQGRAVLTMEDLGCAVGEYGVNVKRGEFYR